MANGIKYQTATVPGNGFDPIWDEVTCSIILGVIFIFLYLYLMLYLQVFTFDVDSPDMAQISFMVLNGATNSKSMGFNNKRERIAAGSIPLTCLRSGFRIVRLYDEYGRNDAEYVFATLFVQVSKTFLD